MVVLEGLPIWHGGQDREEHSFPALCSVPGGCRAALRNWGNLFCSCPGLYCLLAQATSCLLEIAEQDTWEPRDHHLWEPDGHPGCRKVGLKETRPYVGEHPGLQSPACQVTPGSLADSPLWSFVLSKPLPPPLLLAAPLHGVPLLATHLSHSGCSLPIYSTRLWTSSLM